VKTELFSLPNARSRNAVALLVMALCYKPEVASSIPPLFFFNFPNPSSRTVALELTQTVTEIKKNPPWSESVSELYLTELPPVVGEVSANF
jgi:hypothetical protein